MKKSRFTEEQIAYALKQAGLGTPAGEVCRKMGISAGGARRSTRPSQRRRRRPAAASHGI